MTKERVIPLPAETAASSLANPYFRDRLDAERQMIYAR
jgi:hypothetical protein